MPTYHYRCTECSHSFDQFQKFSEEALTECPECQGLIKRVPQPVGIVFKGSGWYITDSRNSKSGSNAASESNGASKSESTSSSGSDASSKAEKKPAATASSS